MAKAMVGSGICAQVVDYLAGRQGPAVKIALQDIATQFAQKVPLRLGFNTFGDEFQAEIVAQGNGCRTDSCVAEIRFNILDEGLVEFEALNRQMF